MNESITGAPREFRHIVLLVVFHFVFCWIASRFYPEPFVPFHHAVSDFGASLTHDLALQNPVSPYFYSAGLLLSAIWMLLMPATFDRGYRHRNLITHACSLGAVGFAMMVAPHDLPYTRPVHVTGSAFLFLALWLMTMVYLYRCRERGHHGLFWTGVIILHVTILSYAVFFAVDSPAKQAAQAVSIIGLLIPLLSGSYVATHDGLARPVEPIS